MAEFITIDFSFTGIFAPLQDAVPPGKTSVDVPLGAIKGTHKAGMAAAWDAFHADACTDADTVLRVYKPEGKGSRLIVPSLYANEAGDGLQINWGSTVVPVQLIDGTIAPIGDVASPAEIDVSIAPAKVGSYSETCLILAITPDANDTVAEVELPVYIRRANLDTGNTEDEAKALIRQVKMLIKQGDTAGLAGMLKQANANGGSGGEVFTWEALPQGVELEVIESKTVSASYGKTVIVKVRANEDVGLAEDTLVWGFGALKHKLLNGGFVTPEKPGKLSFIVERDEVNNKNKYHVDFTPNWANEGLDLSALDSWA